MKGIAHFLTGVALATCLPQVVALAREGSLLPVLGGVGGLLPDLLDFRFVRYFDHYDAEIDPGPVHDDVAALQAAESIAEALVRAMRSAFETGRPFRVITHTVQMGRDLWRRYTVSFMSASDAGMGERGGRLYVRLGPLVNTNGIDLPGSELGAPVVERSLAFDLVAPYDRDYVIDGFTGPTFTFTRESDRLVVNFLDWHHRWTHSLLLAVAAGAVIGVLGALTAGPAVGWLSGILTLLGYAAHVLEDQLGHMGCNLLWPVTRRRMPGLGLLHAGEAIPNFLVVWTSLALVLYNLDRFGGPGYLPEVPFLVLALGLPWLCLGGIHLFRRRALDQPSDESTALSAVGAERLAETHPTADG